MPPSEITVSRHQPVMAPQVKDFSAVAPSGIRVDGTVGGGGHAQVLLEYVGMNSSLFCFDRDPEALKRAQQRLGDDPRIHYLLSSYADVESYLEAESVAFILLDLGLSTDQLLSARGFAHNQDSPLDMRFDPHEEITAAQIINRYSIAQLRDILFRYGEEPLAPRIARRIAEARKTGMVQTTAQLKEIVQEATPERFRIKALARVFQALRIAVNREIEHLERGLTACWKVLQKDGVFCILSYQSIEDRRVKRFFAEKARGCICPPRFPICACGVKPSAKVLTPSALKPTAPEIRTNPAARSAHLRAAVKIG
ncbi:MAG: 16S rRNA (cytosine(1402)-N(4))-methyltransferase RsmH [bacterium]